MDTSNRMLFARVIRQVVADTAASPTDEPRSRTTRNRACVWTEVVDIRSPMTQHVNKSNLISGRFGNVALASVQPGDQQKQQSPQTSGCGGTGSLPYAQSTPSSSTSPYVLTDLGRQLAVTPPSATRVVPIQVSSPTTIVRSSRLSPVLRVLPHGYNVAPMAFPRPRVTVLTREECAAAGFVHADDLSRHVGYAGRSYGLQDGRNVLSVYSPGGGLYSPGGTFHGRPAPRAPRWLADGSGFIRGVPGTNLIVYTPSYDV